MNDNSILPVGASASTSRPSATSPPRRILVVEGEPDTRQLCTEVLIWHGYEVKAVEDGTAGWEELQARNYHLLITGHVLPKLPGLRLVQKLRAARMALPVVLVAKELPLAELARGPSLQLAAMLVKPVAVEVLVDTVRSVLRATSRPFEHIAARAATITPMLQEILERNNDYSHWGLNE